MQKVSSLLGHLTKTVLNSIVITSIVASLLVISIIPTAEAVRHDDYTVNGVQWLIKNGIMKNG